MIKATLILLSIFNVEGFIVNRPRSVSSLAATPANANELFASDGWAAIKKELDAVPIFTCANEKGQPLAYEVEAQGKTWKLPFFFVDVEDAKAELSKAQKATKMDGLDIIPMGLGGCFQMWADDKAVIIPSRQAIMAAGAPPDANPAGQQVPLFACMDIMHENEAGKPCLPMFFKLEEANAALKQAVEMDGGSVDDFEVSSLSLGKAVELLATSQSAETPAFQFIPPASSISHIEDYLKE